MKPDCFPNLAQARPAPQHIIDQVTAITRAELVDAGITFETHTWWSQRQNTEVPTEIMGTYCGWSFERAWYYWVAKGPGLPPDVAEKLHEAHGQAVRVDGHCACPSPREWAHGFAIGHYHVDTPDGLKALAAALKLVYVP